MEGITKEELYDLVSRYHDAEFEYGDRTYVLQPEFHDDETNLVIWDITPGFEKCIAKHEIHPTNGIPESIIDAVLSEKCFNGKSFFEIEQDVVVTFTY